MLHSYSFNGTIWKVRIDAQQSLAVVEVRNGVEYTAYFHIIDLISKTHKVKNWVLHEPWLIGIEDIHNGVLYVHQYRSPEIPEHYGIYAYDVHSQMLLWEQPHFSWFKKTKLTVLAHFITTEGTRSFVEIDPLGRVIQQYGDRVPVHILQEAENMELDAFEQMRFPQAVLLDKPENKAYLIFFKTFAPLLKFHYSEYLNLGKNHVLSYYTMNKNGLQTSMNNYLVIYNEEQQKKLCEVCLAEKVDKFAVDTFYMYQSHLFFVQYPNVLHVYSF
ncbi:MAG: DUF4905 domain-containing protein [Bacteroidia bacterium]|nr:DUF4905 domain-containing protein [Bacteroidia bacterium]MDW8348327.1 DUF4905 domain-containing protein [Bacteroidia bacterium]